MAHITRMAVQAHNKERVNVYLDGTFALALPLFEAARLKVGQEVNDEQLEALRETDAFQRAYGRALDFLARRPRSQREMERYLQKKEVTPPHMERIVARLTELQLLDDLAFARYWIETRETFRPRGAPAIRHELRTKGVNATIIDEALAGTDRDEAEGAYRVALKLMPRLRGIEDRREFQGKLAPSLARRGYGWDVIREVSDRLWRERDDV